MADNAEDLVTRLRLDLDDTEGGAYLWSDSELYRYVDRAQRQFARLTGIFRDSSAYGQLTLAKDVATYNLPASLLEVDQAYLTSDGRPLIIRNADEMLAELGHYSWRTTTGEPRYLVFDELSHAVRVVPVPDKDTTYTIQLVTSRLPLKTISEDYTTLELSDDRHIDALLLWAKHLAYSKNDVDTYDKDLAAAYESRFRAACEEYRQEITRKRRRAGNVAYGGY